MTDRFAEDGTVEGHRVEALVGLVILGIVVDVLAGVGAATIASSMWDFSAIHTLNCFWP